MTLEKKFFSDLEPALDDLMQKFMGVRIKDLGQDLGERLQRRFDINQFIHLSFRQARLKFREEYFRQLLLQCYGNISEVARLADVERRTVHRIIREAKIDVGQIRTEMLKPEYVREQAIGKALSAVLRDYDEILHPKKMQEFYRNIPMMSKDIAKQLPQHTATLDDAEGEFEHDYFSALQKECDSITLVARRAGMRYETVHRKLKALGLVC